MSLISKKMQMDNKYHNYIISISTFLICFLLIKSSVLHGQIKNSVPPFSFLSTTIIGAHQFIQSHPAYDGRGVIIFILDTGVDMGIPGLQRTSTGEVKVVDVRDFSGEGDVPLDSVRITGEGNEKILKVGEGKLYRPDKLSFQPSDSIYWVGWFDEERFKNSTVHDINDNGSTNDRFGVVTFPVKEGNDSYWICYVDMDNDSQLDDELPLRDYRINYDTFKFPTPRSSGAIDKSLTFAININPEKKLVSFHYDDGSHGTHVAGIASGYKINGEDGFNGIAPGAKIISLKIGNNTLSGGATVSGSMKQAYDFVMEFSRTHDVPVVVNMSYGIGSEIEGRSKIENYLDKLLTKNEKVVVCVAAGNEGPGISSIGNPAGAQRVISTGALFPPETGRDLMASSLTDNLIFFFSSRGGETAKPDVIAPGYAASTVPRFMSREKFNGTSMASPQTTGAVALLLSAALQQTPPLKYNSAAVKRALKNGAKELPDATALDQGAGIIQVSEAFDLLEEYAREDSQKINVHYDIKTESPVYSDGTGNVAYWRTGGYFPGTNESQFFKVTAQFADDVSPTQKEEYFKTFILRSNAPWVRINQQETYLKSDQTTGIPVQYDRSLLREPGLYVGKVVAYERNTRGFEFSKSAAAFELWNTLVVPYYFTPENNYQQNFPYRRISPGIIHRYFFAVPPGASGMYFFLLPSANSECYVKPFVFTPEGHEVEGYDFASSREGNSVKGSIVKDELVPGIWEIDIYASVANGQASVYDLGVGFSGIQSEPAVVSMLQFEKGKLPEGTISLHNLFTAPFTGSAKGEIKGYQSEIKREVRGKDIDRYSFTVTDDIEAVEFQLELTKESYNKFTDIAVNILDKEGKSMVNDGLTYRTKTVRLDNALPGTYTLEVIGGFTLPEDEAQWDYSLKELYYRKEKIGIKITAGGKETFKIYPDMTISGKLQLTQIPRITPEDMVSFGTIDFISDKDQLTITSIPIVLKSGLK